MQIRKLSPGAAPHAGSRAFLLSFIRTVPNGFRYGSRTPRRSSTRASTPFTTQEPAE
jgi:hypothetical protein